MGPILNSVVVCDTEPIAMAGFRALLDNSKEYRLAGEETSLLDAAAAVRDLRPSLLVVDKALGTHAVLDWIYALQEAGGPTRIVVWGVSITEAESLRFLQAGASGVVRKTAGLPALLQCLRTVSTGATWMESALLSEGHATRSGRAPLTSREQQVMELVERGLKNKDIGVALGIRTGTVKIHLKHIFEKTGVRGRYGLALCGLKAKGLLASSPVDTM
jgi:two-component system, NarL family, nitrate/nitrite response regulator NarL